MYFISYVREWYHAGIKHTVQEFDNIMYNYNGKVILGQTDIDIIEEYIYDSQESYVSEVKILNYIKI